MKSTDQNMEMLMSTTVLEQKKAPVRAWHTWLAERGVFYDYRLVPHSGDRIPPHPIISNGSREMHSDGFVDLAVLNEDHPRDLVRACNALADTYRTAGVEPHYVVCSDIRAQVVATAIALSLECKVACPESAGHGIDIPALARATNKGRDFEVRAVLARGTIMHADQFKDAVGVLSILGVTILSALCIVNRSGAQYLPRPGSSKKIPITSLVDVDFTEYPAEACPLCEAGSEPIWPKRAPHLLRDVMRGEY